MEQKIRDRYNDAILAQAMRRYGITQDRIRPLDAFESFIYEFERGSQAYILRIAHSLRRTPQLIEGEVDWINYLAAGGVSVARAVRSESGCLVEAVEDGQGGQFLVTAFVKAPGQHPWDAGWSPALYESYGLLMGRMHALAQAYQPARPEWKRPEWDDEMMEFVERYLPAAETAALQKYQAVRRHVRGLPKDAESYGMIHQDAHSSNMHADSSGALTLFDFDECVYSWFANDIAIALFYIVQDAEDAPTFTEEFLTHFFRGYRRANPLDPRWLREFPAFLKLREIELYAVIHRDFDVSNIDHEWCGRFMRGRKDKIAHDVPFIDFDFESLAANLLHDGVRQRS